jgi:hypothetical protein
MPYNPPNDGDVLDETLLLNDVWDQVIAQVTSGSRPTGTEGQVIYETDTGAYQAHDGSTFVEAGRLSGSTTYTPQIDQGGTTNIAKTVTSARYIRDRNIVEVWVQLALTAAGTANNPVIVTLPVAPSGHTSFDPIGIGHITDASVGANSSVAIVYWVSGSNVQFQIDSTATAGRWGSNPNVALASGDTIRFHARYTVA